MSRKPPKCAANTVPCYSSSKQLTQQTPHTNPPTKLAAIQAHSALLIQKDDAQSHKEESGGSSPRSEGMAILIQSTRRFLILLIIYLDSPLPDSRLVNGSTLGGVLGRPSSWGTINWPNGPATGNMAGLAKPPAGRDPKSRARSRDYLKQ